MVNLPIVKMASFLLKSLLERIDALEFPLLANTCKALANDLEYNMNMFEKKQYNTPEEVAADKKILLEKHAAVMNAYKALKELELQLH